MMEMKNFNAPVVYFAGLMDLTYAQALGVLLVLSVMGFTVSMVLGRKAWLLVTLPFKILFCILYSLVFGIIGASLGFARGVRFGWKEISGRH